MASADTAATGILPSGTRTWFRVLAFITVISIGGLVVLGGVVRVTESGLGCPDWPLCYGGFLPPPDLKAIIEYSHRFVASALVGPLVLATCIAAWIAYRKQPWLVVPASVALVLLFIQSGLGAVTVLQELPPFIVLVHLAVAQAMLATLIVLLVVSFAGPLTSAAPLVGPTGRAQYAGVGYTLPETSFDVVGGFGNGLRANPDRVLRHRCRSDRGMCGMAAMPREPVPG